jgi:5-methyltetrahydropteroyltriglutamate--homocysteine methyltransferase
LRRALAQVSLDRLEASTNCGMAPLDHNVATAKLAALAAGAEIVRKETSGS